MTRIRKSLRDPRLEQPDHARRLMYSVATTGVALTARLGYQRRVKKQPSLDPEECD